MSARQIACLHLGDQQVIERFELSASLLCEPQNLKQILIDQPGERAPGKLGYRRRQCGSKHRRLA